jgi:hypothetical protein
VRTTLTIEDDVAARLMAEARRSGRAFKAVVNETLRAGLGHRQPSSTRRQFAVIPHDFGGLQPGVSLDNFAELLELLEGPKHR